MSDKTLKQRDQIAKEYKWNIEAMYPDESDVDRDMEIAGTYGKKLADMPVWITSSTRDPLVNYYLGVSPTWDRLVAISNVPEDCRFSTLTKVCYEDGSATSSSHHAWFAINHDMFSADNGAYPYMTTVNGVGEEVTLTYPNGMISWLTSHTSDYDGAKGVGSGNVGINDSTSMIYVDGFFGIFELLYNAMLKLLRIK